MRKVLSLVLMLCVLAVPAHAEFSALERGQSAGRIIYSVSDNAYLAKSGQAITEEALSGLSSADYRKTGLVADGNSRLILRYKSDTPGTVAFSVSPAMSGARLESFTTRQELTAPLTLASTSNGYQASAVLIAPEAWPESITYPRGNFTVTAAFTPSSGSTNTESLTLTLQAPPVVLIHGAFGDNERMFGYATGSKSGVWHKLEDAGLTVASWNYDSSIAPKTLIASNTNGLAQIISDTLNTLNSQDIAATRVDLVTHSSGGIVARQYLRTDTDTGNRTPNSYGLGTVRRVVTIASPNRGTPLGSYMSGKFDTLPASWQNWKAKNWWENVGSFILLYVVRDKTQYDEVMGDIALGSSYLAGLGYPGVPFHSIYGKVKDDEGEVAKLFDYVVSGNVAALKKIDWLPEQMVKNLTSSSTLSLISGILRGLSDDIRFKELLGALHGSEDHDLIVSESSARDVFPDNAVTSFTGLKAHSHIMIARQDDVGDRVLALLRGGTENFMINTVSATVYDAAFDAFVDSFAAPVRASTSDDLSKYLAYDVNINTSDPVDEYMGDDSGEESVIQSMKLSGNSASAFSEDIYVTLDDGDGNTKFFVISPTNKQSFDVDMWAYADDKGLYEVSYSTIQDGKLKISPTQIVAFPPKFKSSTTPVVYWSSVGGRIYAHLGDEVPAGLIVKGEGMTYDISSQYLGVASYHVADTSIAEVTREGKIRALKEGTTTITATAYGQSTSVTFIVKPSDSEADTTRDLEVSGSGDSDSGSSGGCSAGFTFLAALSVLGLALKRR